MRGHREVSLPIKEHVLIYLQQIYNFSTMYEKYNCETVGKAGGGGEYGVQVH